MRFLNRFLELLAFNTGFIRHASKTKFPVNVDLMGRTTLTSELHILQYCYVLYAIVLKERIMHILNKAFVSFRLFCHSILCSR
ncbi:hypothetical protein GeomeDRAFT_3276 [Geobacter metallireducens RCH3]|nr:hypothetical protein GeomeDRAFT_3276 [Geobacter metallireducens RCH3]